MENPAPSSCSTLQRRRRRRVKKKTKPSPFSELFHMDDLIIDILSRLPAKDVLQCQCVCRRWKDLTLTRDFTNLHIQRSYPMILMEDNSCLGLERGLLDRCWESARKRPKLLEFRQLQSSASAGGIEFSHNGLIVAFAGIFKDGSSHEVGVIIYNPIDSDSVHIVLPDYEIEPSCIYGVFFHPVQKEYCTLWRITLSLEPCKIQYKILNLESNPTWRDIKNPCTQNARICEIRPILIGMYLYWMVDPHPHSVERYSSENTLFMCDIMEYDIKNEEFRVLACPVPVIQNECDYNVNLVDIDGALSLVQIFPSKELVKIDIWTLIDDGEQLWTSRNYIISSDVYTGSVVPKALAFWGGELILKSDGRLYVCNLKLGTFRKFRRKYKDHVEFFPHVTCVVSLRNCKSKIYIWWKRMRVSKRVSCRGEEVQTLR